MQERPRANLRGPASRRAHRSIAPNPAREQAPAGRALALGRQPAPAREQGRLGLGGRPIACGGRRIAPEREQAPALERLTLGPSGDRSRASKRPGSRGPGRVARMTVRARARGERSLRGAIACGVAFGLAFGGGVTPASAGQPVATRQSVEAGSVGSAAGSEVLARALPVASSPVETAAPGQGGSAAAGPPDAPAASAPDAAPSDPAVSEPAAPPDAPAASAPV